MGNIFLAAIFGLLWIVNLVNATGLDLVYGITEKARLIVLAIFCLKLLLSRQKGNHLIEQKDFLAFGGMIILFTFSSFINGYGVESFEYLWVFVLVYLLSSVSLNDRVLQYISIGYCVAGLFILYVYNYGSLLSGWNENSIAMIGMHSFLVFLIAFFDSKSFKDKVIVVVVTLVCARMLDVTNSRSGMLFLIVGMLFAINVIPREFVYRNKRRITILLFIPLIVSIVIIVISHSSYYAALENWSLLKYGKPIFNGRDRIWERGFVKLSENILLGIGSASTANWHNSAVACLVGYGVLGYLCWISSFKQIINRAVGYLNDAYVQGCVVSFMVLYAQQSVELGFISKAPSVLPYVMLGILLGRVKYLREGEWYEESQYYHSDI